MNRIKTNKNIHCIIRLYSLYSMINRPCVSTENRLKILRLIENITLGARNKVLCNIGIPRLAVQQDIKYNVGINKYDHVS